MSLRGTERRSKQSVVSSLFLNSGRTKKNWTPEEDEALRVLIENHGTGNWSFVAEALTDRTGKQCRERWHNHLQNGIKKGEWSEEEDRIIVTMQQSLGNQWAQIAKYLPGRTDNAVKNRFHATVRARKNFPDAHGYVHAESTAVHYPEAEVYSGPSDQQQWQQTPPHDSSDMHDHYGQQPPLDEYDFDVEDDGIQVMDNNNGNGNGNYHYPQDEEVYGDDEDNLYQQQTQYHHHQQPQYHHHHQQQQQYQHQYQYEQQQQQYQQQQQQQQQQHYYQQQQQYQHQQYQQQQQYHQHNPQQTYQQPSTQRVGTLQLEDCYFEYQGAGADIIDAFPSPPPPEDGVPSSPKALSIMTMSPLTATMVDDDFDQYFDEEEQGDADDGSDPCLIKPIAWNPSESYDYDQPITPKNNSYCNTFCGLQSFTRQQQPQKAIPVEIDKSYSEMVGQKSGSIYGYSQSEQLKNSLSSPPRNSRPFCY